jgi:hypothetical protein
MSRDTDWHVFDKACEITAMAARGTAGQVTPAQVGEIFTQVYGALRDAANALDRRDHRLGSSQTAATGRADTMPTSRPVFQDRDVAEALLQHPFVGLAIVASGAA